MIGHKAGDEWREYEQEYEIVMRGGQHADPGGDQPAHKEECPERDQDYGEPIRERRRDGRKARMNASVENHIVSGKEQRNEKQEDVKREAHRSHDWMGDHAAAPGAVPRHGRGHPRPCTRGEPPRGNSSEASELPYSIKDSQHGNQKAKPKRGPLADVI